MGRDTPGASVPDVATRPFRRGGDLRSMGSAWVVSEWGRCALVALAFGALGPCGRRRKIHLPTVVNQRPEVTLTQSPVTTNSPYFYSYELSWTGFDPDGQIDHYLYCVDPPTTAGVDTPWVSTTENRKTFVFHSSGTSP